MSTQVSNPIVVVSANEYEILRLQKDVGSEIIKNIQTVLQNEDINFTDDLSNSFSLVMWQGKTHVESSNKYASLVDRGMSPGNWVNYDALYDWVRIKLNVDDDIAVGITWKILKKIQKDGIRPTRFVKKALKRTIGQHGVLTIRQKTSTRTNKSTMGNKIGKMLNKVNKGIRKIKRIITTINNNINKVIKPIRKYK